MCFSASASFVASGVLLAGGIASVSHLKKSSQLPFAAIPLLFSTQQFFEGVLWLSLGGSRYAGLEGMATIAFLIFAQVVWPTWVPLSVLLMEKSKIRRRILWGLLSLGAVVSVFLGYYISVYYVKASIGSHHIHYQLDFPGLPIVNALLYLLPVVVSPLISGSWKVRSIGVAVFISFIVTRIFYGEYIISVWCFFAAIISSFVYLVLKEEKKAGSENKLEPAYR